MNDNFFLIHLNYFHGAEFSSCLNVFISHHHHHHHLFLNRSFLPCSARVRHLPRYEASPHIPEHYSFRVQTKLIRVIFHTFSPSLPALTLPPPPPHFNRPTPNHLHSYAPHGQTISIYHASPPQPCSEHPKDCTRPVIISVRHGRRRLRFATSRQL